MRKFGIEIELNSFDQRDFKKFPLYANEQPLGMCDVAQILKDLNLPVDISAWQHTHNNSKWICKPDSSCGIEVCSPVSEDLVDINKFVNALCQNKNIKIDDRCSFHVHFEISDCLEYKEINFNLPHYSQYDFEKSIKLASILAWWIKCEPVFFDSVPNIRKINKYCQCIGISDLFNHDDIVDPKILISKMGDNKYLSVNVFHLLKGNRPTIEFRLAGSEACLDFNFIENWINLLSHFIDCAIKKGIPENFCWLNPMQVMIFLDFIDEKLDLKLEKIRNWFLARIYYNINSNLKNWDINFRKFSILDLRQILNNLRLDKELISYLSPMNK